MADSTFSPSQSLTGQRRRNGQLQSCEPCRKSKLKCDHVLPTCGRCVKRRCVEKCVYHPNPLAQARHSSISSIASPGLTTTTTPEVVLQSIEPSPPFPYSDLSSITVQPVVAGAPSRVQRAASAPVQDIQRNLEPSSKLGFVGATFYSSILSEELCITDDVSAELETLQRQKPAITHDQINRGCQVLLFLRDKFMISRFVSRWFEKFEGSGSLCIEVVVREWLSKLWTHHESALTSQDPEKIRRLSALLWRNTQTALNFDKHTTAVEWARLGSGQNIRWEVIGLISVVVGFFVITLDATDPLLSEHNCARQTFLRNLTEVSHQCLTFSRDCESLDDMFLWLTIEHATGMLSVVKGDRNYATYLSIGEMISAVIHMGLHQGVKTDDNTPFFLLELRKRALVIVYSVEVYKATSLGRPPRLSYRYCKLDLPLDLTDKEITLKPHDINAAIKKLDKNGYNPTARAIGTGTWMRVAVGFAKLREDILDLTLSNYSREEILQRADTIQEQTEAHWKTLPSHVGKTRAGIKDIAKLHPIDAICRSAISQSSHVNELLLQRVLVRKTGGSPEKLVYTARASFKNALQLSQRHDLPSFWNIDYVSILVGNGLRSAAIIAVELLKQEQLSPYPENPLLPRSETIQDLSVFAARLGTVDPTSGSYSACEQGRKVITRILDKILTPPSVGQLRHGLEYRTSQLPQQGQIGQKQPPIGLAVPPDEQGGVNIGMSEVGPFMGVEDGPLFDMPLTLGTDEGFLQWLEKLDWERALNDSSRW